jgi:hypothetical protein
MHTVVSIYPRRINEYKPLIPPQYVVEASENNDPQVLHINHGTRTVYMDSERGNMPVPVMSEEIAHAFVYDFINASIAMFPGDGQELPAHPGLFYVEGRYSRDDVKTDKGLLQKLKVVIECQDRWFIRLVKMADDDFARTGMHKVVTDLQRLAAKRLGMTDRPWIAGMVTKTMKCMFCTSNIPENAIVCPICRNVINATAYKALTSGAPTNA